MLDHTIESTKINRPDWGDDSRNEVLNISITRGSANVLLHLMAITENSISFNEADWHKFKDAAGEYIGAIWIAKE